MERPPSCASLMRHHHQLLPNGGPGKQLNRVYHFCNHCVTQSRLAPQNAHLFEKTTSLATKLACNETSVIQCGFKWSKTHTTNMVSPCQRVHQACRAARESDRGTRERHKLVCCTMSKTCRRLHALLCARSCPSSTCWGTHLDDQCKVLGT